MPNILAHCGVQGAISHALIKDASPAWITVGCLIPDVPWIFVRVASEFIPHAWSYDLRLYAIVQATLGLSLVLSAGLAFLSPRPALVFRILALNAVLHLLLDASQIKWANGVHLFAPFSWTMHNWGWFWPESLITVLCTIAGVIYLLWATLRQPQRSQAPAASSAIRLTLGAVCLTVYVLLPFALWHGPYNADNHFVKTLRERNQRAGRYIEMDRADYVGGKLYSLVGEGIRVGGQRPEQTANINVSVRGIFLDAETIRIDQLQAHWPRFRDGASYLGLIWIGVLWLKAAWTLRRWRPS